MERFGGVNCEMEVEGEEFSVGEKGGDEGKFV